MSPTTFTFHVEGAHNFKGSFAAMAPAAVHQVFNAVTN